METVGRYALDLPIASGGMGTVYLGRLLGAAGFGRSVAIKAMLPSCAADPEFVSMFLDEARLAARIQHPNVVQTLDVVHAGGTLILVMEYAHGESLSRLTRGGVRVPVAIAASVACDVLDGLHAAHEAKDAKGESLGIVHRDVSPQNVLVTVEGLAKVLDFGVAKAKGRLFTTRDGSVKGKLAYMPPEQFQGRSVDRRADVFAAAVVLWEMLTGSRLFAGDSEAATVGKILAGDLDPPRALEPSVPPELDEIVMRALAREPEERFATAEEMARAIERAVTPARRTEVAEWVKSRAGEVLESRARAIADVERVSSDDFGAEAARVVAEVAAQAAPSISGDRGERADLPTVENSAVPVHTAPRTAGLGAHRGRRWLAAAIVAVGTAAAIVVVARVKGDEGHPVANATRRASDPPVPAAPPPPPGPDPRPAPDVAPAPSAPAVASASVAVAASAPPPVTKSTRPRATKGSGDDCATPCSFDARGVKVCKVECLR